MILSGDKMLKVKPGVRLTAIDMVVASLRDYIIKNHLQIGDRLPPEHDLSDALGVSRNILREGMRIFRTLGVIESKPKIGAVIKSLHPENPFEGYFPFMGRDQRSINEIMDTRIALETGAAPLIIEHCAPEDISELEVILRDFVDDTDKLRQADIAFHQRLVDITHNRILQSLTPLTVEFFELKSKDEIVVTTPVPEIIRQHQKIIEALRKGSASELIAAINEHYKSYKGKE